MMGRVSSDNFCIILVSLMEPFKLKSLYSLTATSTSYTIITTFVLKANSLLPSFTVLLSPLEYHLEYCITFTIFLWGRHLRFFLFLIVTSTSCLVSFKQIMVWVIELMLRIQTNISTVMNEQLIGIVKKKNADLDITNHLLYIPTSIDFCKFYPLIPSINEIQPTA